MPRLDRPTLRTVAERAGVSRMTVSRALRGDPGLPQSTCQRIRAIADEVGFRPDPKLAELMVYLRRNRQVKRTETIAFVHVYPRQVEPHSPTELRFLAGARRRAEQLGYQLEVFTVSSEHLPPRRLAQILYTRGIRGVILQSSRGFRPELHVVAERFSCAVVGGGVPEDLPLHVARCHHAHSMSLACETLRARLPASGLLYVGPH